MKISYNWLQSFFQKKLPVPEKLADLLTFHSFEVESVKKESQDWVLDIDVLPNRAHDCLSHQGIAREIAALLKYSFKLVDYSKKIKEISKERADKVVKVEIKDKELCPRYTARVITDVKVGPSPKWIQQRLKVCGLKPINNVVDIANYVMLETGQPLHAFDADKLQASGEIKKIIVRRAKKGEKIVSLDDEKYDLDENVLVIADEKDPVCVAGIKGGIGPGIDNQTKQVILEAANFNPQIIRQGSRQLKLVTDASWRFENGLDPNLTESAIDMCAYLIQEIVGGQVFKGRVDVYPKKVRPKKARLDIGRVNSLLGIEIPVKEIKNILERLGFEIKDLGGGLKRKFSSPTPKFQVTVPTWRMDVTIPEDLIEEVGRVYGFEKIPSQLPSATLVPAERKEDLIYQNKVKDILANLGFSEVYNYSLIGDKEIDFYKNRPDYIDYAKDSAGKPLLIELLNPVSQEQKYLRPSLIPILIKNTRENKKYFERVRLFEIGKVFHLNKQQVIEKKKMASIISLEEKNEQSQEFYRLKGVVDTLLNRIGISDIWYDDDIPENDSSVPDFCHPNKRAQIKVGDDLLGWVGEIDSQVLAKIDIESRIAGFEIDFDKLVQLATEERIYSPPSKYPAMVRDIALLVGPGVKVVEVLNLINAADGPLVRDVDLFDMYEGEEIPDGKKNLAFHIIFQSDDHTLTDKEVNALQGKIIKALEEEGGWEVRR
jgi:phenylalanyl-tRNA synthetase beta chain